MMNDDDDDDDAEGTDLGDHVVAFDQSQGVGHIRVKSHLNSSRANVGFLPLCQLVLCLQQPIRAPRPPVLPTRATSMQTVSCADPAERYNEIHTRYYPPHIIHPPQLVPAQRSRPAPRARPSPR